MNKFLKNLGVLILIAFLMAVVIVNQKDIGKYRLEVKQLQRLLTIDAMKIPIDEVR